MSKRLDDLNAKLLRTFGAGIDGPVAFVPFQREDAETRALRSRFMDTLGDLADARQALADARSAAASRRPNTPAELDVSAPKGPAGDASPAVRIVPRYDGAGLMRYMMIYGPRQTLEVRIRRDGADNPTELEVFPIDEDNLRDGKVPNPGPPQ